MKHAATAEVVTKAERLSPHVTLMKQEYDFHRESFYPSPHSNSSSLLLGLAGAVIAVILAYYSF
jgi:ABC-type cobalt transport system substrate-binding protein